MGVLGIESPEDDAPGDRGYLLSFLGGDFLPGDLQGVLHAISNLVYQC